MEQSNYAAHPGRKACPSNLPSHVAIIPDGNGRWAKSKGLSRTQGHRRGVEVFRDVISLCQEKKIQVLTLFAFGRENWKRPAKEVRNLFRLFFIVLRKEIHRLHENNICLRIVGDRQHFHTALLNAIQEAEHLTQNNTGLVLNIAVNYSGRWDLLHAIQKVLQTSASKENPGCVTEKCINAQLSLYGLPEPDLFIRTGGVQRISNFMLWELAYTELFFTSTLWPDFSRTEFTRALEDFASRERRFGLTGDQL